MRMHLETHKQSRILLLVAHVFTFVHNIYNKRNDVQIKFLKSLPHFLSQIPNSTNFSPYNQNVQSNWRWTQNGFLFIIGYFTIALSVQRPTLHAVVHFYGVLYNTSLLRDEREEAKMRCEEAKMRSKKMLRCEARRHEDAKKRSADKKMRRTKKQRTKKRR